MKHSSEWYFAVSDRCAELGFEDDADIYWQNGVKAAHLEAEIAKRNAAMSRAKEQSPIIGDHK